MPYEVKENTTAIEPFTAVYTRIDGILSGIAELRKSEPRHSDKVPGTALRVVYSGSRFGNTSHWHDRTGIRVTVPELGFLRKVDLIERTVTNVTGSDEPYAVNAWSGHESRGDYMLAHDPTEEKANVSIQGLGYLHANQSPDYPELLDWKPDPVERILKNDRYKPLWVPDKTRLVDLPKTERLRFKLAASKILEMCDAVEALIEGADALEVLESLNYVYSRRQLSEFEKSRAMPYASAPTV